MESQFPESQTPPSAALLRALAAHPDSMADLIAALNIVVIDADTLVELMGRASRQAVRLVTDVDFAGVTAQFDGQDPFTAAHTGATVLIVDERQYQQHDGPCLQAMRTNRRTHMNMTQVQQLWPLLAEGAAAAGVNSFLALPLHAAVGAAAVGSLNLYSAGENAMNFPDGDLLTVLTEYLDRGLDSYRRHQPRYGTDDLQAALHRRAVIEQAVGVLMATHRVDADQALDRLLEMATSSRNPLLEQARQVIAAVLPRPAD